MRNRLNRERENSEVQNWNEGMTESITILRLGGKFFQLVLLSNFVAPTLLQEKAIGEYNIPRNKNVPSGK